MENLHLKNIKNNNIETIKQTSWFKEFNPEQQYYIESGLENEIDISSFVKKEISGDEMFDILQELEMQKYNEQLTTPYHMFVTHERLKRILIINSVYGALDL